jgi:hypothetical protein
MGRQISKGVAPTVVLGLPGVEISTSSTISSNRIYYVDTTGGTVTLTLPATPSTGDVVQVVDVKGNFGTNNLVVSPGSSEKIMRQTAADTMTVNVSGAAFSLVYHNSTNGWLLENI